MSLERKTMVAVTLKSPVGATVRTVDSKCVSGTKVEVTTPGGHVITTDEPINRGGGDEAASPLMYFTSSLAACQTVQIVKVAEAMRFKHGAIDITTSTTTDRVAGVDGNDKVMRFCAAEMQITIETNEPAEKIERLKELSEDRCPVGALFIDAGYPPEVTWLVKPMSE
jgi:uncharacterized OsmC-like protein